MTRRAGMWIGIALVAAGLGGLTFAGVSGARGAWPYWGCRAAACGRAPYPAMMGRLGGGYGRGIMGRYGGMMGGYGGPWAGAPGANAAGGASSGAPTGTDAVRATENAVPAGATVNAAANQIRFTSADVRFTVVAGPPDGKEMSFRTAALTNPAVVVPPGAHVVVTVLNGDPALPHDWVLTAAAPPYGSVPAGSAAAGASTRVLPPAGASGAAEADATFTAPASGTFYYVCTVPGHAAAGMYGQFEVGG